MKTKALVLSFVLCFFSNLNAQKIPITTSSKEALSFYKNGWQLENQLRLDEAENMYHKAIDIDSAFALAYLRLAMVKDNYDTRRKYLKQALNLINNVTEPERLWIMARVDFYSTGYDGTKEYGYFKDLLQLYPNDEIANYLFAFVNLHHGVTKPELAIAHYKKAIEINPDFIQPYNELAYAYMENKNFKNAKEITKKYIKLLPNSVNPLDTYAEIFMRSGDYKKSIKYYKKVLKIDQKYPWALIGITANMNFLNKHDEGRKFLERLHDEKLSDYEYRYKWRARVTSYLDEKNFNEAVNTLEEQKQQSIQGKNKREPNFHIYYSYLRKTRFYFEYNEAEQGFEEYKKWNDYVQKNNKNEKTRKRINNLRHYYLAYSALIDNDLLSAQNHLDKFISINQGETDKSKVLLSRIFLAQNAVEKAIAKIEETDLKNPYNQYWLMIAYKKTGDKLNAKMLKNKILNLNEPNNINLSLVRKKTLETTF